MVRNILRRLQICMSLFLSPYLSLISSPSLLILSVFSSLSPHLDLSRLSPSSSDLSAFETIAKKSKHRDTRSSLSMCGQQFIINYQEHNRSWKGSASVLASVSRLLCGEQKRDLTVSKKKKNDICNRTQITPQKIISITGHVV